VPQIIGSLSVGATVQQNLRIVLGMAAVLIVISGFLKTGAKAGEKESART
jgi:hypothetical protein